VIVVTNMLQFIDIALERILSSRKKKTKHDFPSEQTVIIQGVSEFDRQTFRADSIIKNKHKTLNTYGVKNA
jgi:hypothetical protein